MVSDNPFNKRALGCIKSIKRLLCVGRWGAGAGGVGECLLSFSFCQHFSGFHVRPPSDHLSQIHLTDLKDQTSPSVWLWLTNFTKIAFYNKTKTQNHEQLLEIRLERATVNYKLKKTRRIVAILYSA